ncbi:zinc-binding dehydrogenase [Quadrisphaera sp. DSM 44207]|uniref:zinc-binding dehydrogenase n=1 Tax=Quadrisphaera sp. DSM 44207 TaxID=1881057 RepID=UPI0015A3D85D|nr:zinc-binding dehydrogenase [Quadrisphaera sp. DSM 44207]
MGLALVQVLRLAGARVVAVARSAARLRLARDLGADVLVDASADDVAARVREATGGAGADVVFELVGTAASGAAALGCLGTRGALVYLGYSGERVALDPLALVVPEQRILTSVGNRRAELVRALELGATGRLRTAITPAPLEQAPRVLEDLRAGRVVGRAVLVP